MFATNGITGKQLALTKTSGCSMRCFSHIGTVLELKHSLRVTGPVWVVERSTNPTHNLSKFGRGHSSSVLGELCHKYFAGVKVHDGNVPVASRMW